MWRAFIFAAFAPLLAACGPVDDAETDPPSESRTDPLVCASQGGHLTLDRTIALPGRGMALAWAPQRQKLALGGHFNDHAATMRYDTKVYDVTTGSLVATGDRKSGRVAGWSFDPAADRWDEKTISSFAGVGFKEQPTWFTQHPDVMS